MESLALLFAQFQSCLFGISLVPCLFAMDWSGFLEEGYNATGWFPVSVIQLAIMLVLIAPL
jgi:hypothetical protein